MSTFRVFEYIQQLRQSQIYIVLNMTSKTHDEDAFILRANS